MTDVITDLYGSTDLQNLNFESVMTLNPDIVFQHS